MNGHWIGGTRKFNKHWQSGNTRQMISQPFGIYGILYNGNIALIPWNMCFESATGDGLLLQKKSVTGAAVGRLYQATLPTGISKSVIVKGKNFDTLYTLSNILIDTVKPLQAEYPWKDTSGAINRIAKRVFIYRDPDTGEQLIGTSDEEPVQINISPNYTGSVVTWKSARAVIRSQRGTGFTADRVIERDARTKKDDIIKQILSYFGLPLQSKMIDSKYKYICETTLSGSTSYISNNMIMKSIGLISNSYYPGRDKDYTLNDVDSFPIGEDTGYIGGVVSSDMIADSGYNAGYSGSELPCLANGYGIGLMYFGYVGTYNAPVTANIIPDYDETDTQTVDIRYEYRNIQDIEIVDDFKFFK